ncbi:MAG: hypothetical protein M3478_03885 [Planctomycetota bacterium]|nr:hypothetical protein [Planctomycetota bacterium]
MIVPAKDDPRRPLYLAVRSMWLLGGVFTAVGLLLCFPVVVRNTTWWSTVIVVVVLLIPGTSLLVAAAVTRPPRSWALAVAIPLVLALGLIVLFVLGLLVKYVGVQDLVRGKDRVSLTFAAILLGLFVLHALTVWQLCSSFEAIKLPELTDRGFEPLLHAAAEPVLPIEVDDAAPPAAR